MDRTDSAKKNSRRRAGAVHGHQSPSQNRPPSARNTAGREQSDLLVGFEVEGSGQGHSPERVEQTMNKSCKLVKKNLIRLQRGFPASSSHEAI
jgi:hypothetical protein